MLKWKLKMAQWLFVLCSGAEQVSNERTPFGNNRDLIELEDSEPNTNNISFFSCTPVISAPFRQTDGRCKPTDKHEGTREMNETQQHVGNMTCNVTNPWWPTATAIAHKRHTDAPSVYTADLWYSICESTVCRGGVSEDYRDAVLFGGKIPSFRQYLLSPLVPT